jgi:hypothetical protein
VLVLQDHPITSTSWRLFKTAHPAVNQHTITVAGLSACNRRSNWATFSAGRINKGTVKLTVVSKQGKEAVVAILKEGDFFGEGCLAGQQLRMATAVAIMAA